MGFAFPFLLLNAAVIRMEDNGFLAKEAIAPPMIANEGYGYSVRLMREGRVEDGEMDDYLVGVLLAEMPANFCEEALKAQAVAARTYARKRFVIGGKHENGSVCLDSSCCQAYISPEEYIRQGGTQEAVDRIISAVRSTSGEVLVYEDELIEATYFSCSGGSTEAAVEVWGREYPYLQSVPSPGEENALHFEETFRFTPEEFAARLALSPDGEPSDWITLTAYSVAGTVRKMVICGVSFSGQKLRQLLALPSAAFEICIEDSEIVISTRGHGHRVGMSQYGAEAMAQSGSTYQQILAHYYPGSTLQQLEPDRLPAALRQKKLPV